MFIDIGLPATTGFLNNQFLLDESIGLLTGECQARQREGVYLMLCLCIAAHHQGRRCHAMRRLFVSTRTTAACIAAALECILEQGAVGPAAPVIELDAVVGKDEKDDETSECDPGIETGRQDVVVTLLPAAMVAQRKP